MNANATAAASIPRRRREDPRTGRRPGACALACLLASGCTAPRLPDAGSLRGDGLGKYFRAHGGMEAISSRPIEFFDGGPAIKAGMLNLVERAEDHISVDTFLLNDGPESEVLLDALEAKQRQGVEVHVIGDASSRFVPEPHAFDSLAVRAIPHAEFNPFRGAWLAWPPYVLERDHRKFWIADGRVLFFGGANLNDPSLMRPEDGGNLDLMVRIDSPEAASRMRASFAETWNRCGKQRLVGVPAGFRVATHPADTGGGARFWLFNQDRTFTRSTMTGAMFDGLFGSARDSIWLVQPYTFVNSHILSRVREMCDRGVEVNLVLSTKFQGVRFRYASYFGIEDLLDAGARVWIFDSETTPLHYKCVLVDDKLACMGSSNLNFRSYRLSRELNAVFEDRHAVAEMRRLVDSVRSGSVPVTRAQSGKYRSPLHFVWWVLMQWGG